LGTDGNPVPSLSLTSVAPDPSVSTASDIVPCIFTTQYAVPSTVPAAGIALKYYVAMEIDPSKMGTANMPGGGNAFLIPAAPVTLATADGPNLSPGLYLEKFQATSVGGGQSTISWNIVLQVVETAAAQIAAGSIPVISGASIQCGTQSYAVVPSNTQLATVSGSKQLQFTVSMSVIDASYNLAATSGWPTCYLNGNANFNLVGAPPAARPFVTGQGIAVLFPASPPPVPPSGLTATPGNGQVALSWTASPGAASYNVYRAATSGTEGTVPYRADVVGTSFVDSAVAHSTQYFYVITATP
jgi:hypothetical protein